MLGSINLFIVVLGIIYFPDFWPPGSVINGMINERR